MENLLEIKSLNTYYGESHILRDVDLNVKSGEMVCLIGRNGVGKTTLLNGLFDWKKWSWQNNFIEITYWFVKTKKRRYLFGW